MDPATGKDRALFGVVEDGDGRPLSGVRVSFEGDEARGHAREAQTGPDGAFSIPLPAGFPATTAVVVDRLRVWRVPVAPAEGERLRIVLAPPDCVPVRVLTPGAAPVPTRYGWTALRRDLGGSLVEGPSGVAAGPRFAAAGLSPGDWAIVVWAGPFLPAVHEPVRLDGKSCHPLVTVEVFRRGAAVAGRVLARSGAPRADCTVAVRADASTIRLPESRTTARTDSGGRYRIEGLPSGRYAIVVGTEGGAPAEVLVDLVEREERALDVTA